MYCRPATLCVSQFARLHSLIELKHIVVYLASATLKNGVAARSSYEEMCLGVE